MSRASVRTQIVFASPAFFSKTKSERRDCFILISGHIILHVPTKFYASVGSCPSSGTNQLLQRDKWGGTNLGSFVSRGVVQRDIIQNETVAADLIARPKCVLVSVASKNIGKNACLCVCVQQQNNCLAELQKTA